MVAVRITPEEATRCDWYHKGRLPDDAEIFPWTGLTADERAALERTRDGEAWIPADLEPWRFDEGLDPVSSVGLRANAGVVGWVLNHRIAPDMVRFTDAYVHPELQRMGALFPLLVASLERLRGTGTVCTFVTSAQFGRMLPFVQRRIAPFGHFFGETRGVWKDLPPPTDSPAPPQGPRSVDVIVNVSDRDAWNRLVAASPEGHVFQSWEWGELQAELGGRPVRIAAEEDGRGVACVQALVFQGESRRFVYVPRGPVADPLDRTAAVALIDAVVAVAGREGATLVRFEPQWADDADAAGHFAGRGFAPVSQHIMPPRTLLVDLRQELDGIWRSFHSNTRNRIRLAEKLGVTVRVGAADDVATFVRLHDETNARHGLRRERPEQFHAAARLFGPGDGVRLYLAEAEGAVLAGIMVFAWGTAATYLWGASSGSEDARRLHPNQLLHWTAMQWARERGCTTYDLFGIPDYDVDVLEAEYGTRTDRWWNLYRFKRGFGGTVHRHLGTFDGTIQS